LMTKHKARNCKECLVSYTPTTGNQKYCVDCGEEAQKVKSKEWHAESYANLTPKEREARLAYCREYDAKRKANMTPKEREAQKVKRRKTNRAARSKTLRFDILERDNFTCQYCGWQPGHGGGRRLEVDHRDPLAGKKRRYSKDDLVTACSECNGGKSDKFLTPRECCGLSFTRGRDFITHRAEAHT